MDLNASMSTLDWVTWTDYEDNSEPTLDWVTWTDYEDSLEPTVKHIHQYLQIIPIVTVIMIGFIGNIVMCLTLLRTPQLRTVTNIFTATLGVADLGIICFILPMWMVVIVLDKDTDIIDLSLCEVTGFLTISLMLVNVATVSGISLDRYFCICHPLKYPNKVTSRKVLIALGYIWIQSVFLASLPFYGWGMYAYKPQKISICLPDWRHHPSYSLFTLTLGLILPFFILIFSYICIFQAARKQARRIHEFTFQLVDPWANNSEGISNGTKSPSKTGGDGRDKTSHRNELLHRLSKYKPPISQSGRVYTPISKNIKTLKTVFIAVGVFLLCWVPYLTVTTYVIHNDMAHQAVAEYITTLLVFSISAINPIIFIFLTRDFRNAVLRLLDRCLICMKCKKLSGKVGPYMQNKRLKVTIMGQEASVHVIHLKQDKLTVSPSEESNHYDSPNMKVSAGCDPLFIACTSIKKDKYIHPTNNELPALKCNGESLQLSDYNEGRGAAETTAKV